MRLGLVVWLAVAALAVQLAAPTGAAAQSACGFKLGFRAIADQLPERVGSCLEDEHFNPANGDAVQKTSGGLLVWRKADNFTAFTDGYRSWVNGPFGLQQRLNSEKFAWEQGAPAASGCAVGEAAVTFEGDEAGPDGARTYRGTVRNPCAEPIHLTIDLVERASGANDPSGAPLLDAPSAFVRDLAPGASTPITVRTRAVAGRRSYGWRVTPLVGEARNSPCLDVGADRCLAADPRLASAVQTLGSLEEGQWLLRGAARGGVRLLRGRTPPGVLGFYRPAARTITIDSGLDSYSSWVRAVVLAHELRHAVDDAQGNLGASASACYEDEESAFRTQSRVWAQLWGGNLPSNVDGLHAELNAITVMAARDPAGLAATLTDAYHEQCGRSKR
jgi:hypothetical protein